MPTRFDFAVSAILHAACLMPFAVFKLPLSFNEYEVEARQETGLASQSVPVQVVEASHQEHDRAIEESASDSPKSLSETTAPATDHSPDVIQNREPTEPRMAVHEENQANASPAFEGERAPLLTINPFPPSQMESLVRRNYAKYLVHIADVGWFYLDGTLRHPRKLSKVPRGSFRSHRTFAVPQGAIASVMKMVSRRYYEYEASQIVIWMAFTDRFDSYVLQEQQTFATAKNLSLDQVESMSAELAMRGAIPTIRIVGYQAKSAK